ncbi:hypothetical protein ACFX1S_041147 [Malus domestica]
MSDSWFLLIRVVVIPGMLLVVDDGSAETSGWVDASSGDGDGGQVHQEHLSELGKRLDMPRFSRPSSSNFGMFSDNGWNLVLLVGPPIMITLTTFSSELPMSYAENPDPKCRRRQRWFRLKARNLNKRNEVVVKKRAQMHNLYGKPKSVVGGSPGNKEATATDKI